MRRGAETASVDELRLAVLENKPRVGSVRPGRLGRKTARPGPDRQIDVVSVSPGNTGEVKRAEIAVTRVASPPRAPRRARVRQRRRCTVRAGSVSGNLPIQQTTDHCAAGCGRRRAGTAAPGPPRGQSDRRVGVAVGDLRGDGPRSGLSAEAARTADHQRGQRLGDRGAGGRITAGGLEHDDGVLALTFVLDVSDLVDDAELTGGGQRCEQADALRAVQQLEKSNDPMTPAAANGEHAITA